MSPSDRWRVQFLALSAIWGSSFLFIKVIGRHWPAPWVALGRVALGALTLVVLLAIRGERLRFRRRTWQHLAVAAVIFNVIPFTLFAYGETKVSSVLAGLWNGTTPLWVLIAVLLAFGEEHPSRERVIGLMVGFLGVIVLLGPWGGLGHGQLLGHLACAGAAACYGLGFPYTKRYLAREVHSGLELAAGQLLCATAILAVLAPLGNAPTTHIGLDGLGSIVALGVLGSGIAYVLYYAIVRHAGATIASTVTYVIPLFSTVLGVIVLGEGLHWNQPLGAAVVFAGIAISHGFGRARLTQPAPTEPAP